MLRSISLRSALTALALGVALTGCASAEETPSPAAANESGSPSADSATPTTAETASPSTTPSPEPTASTPAEEAVTTLAVKITGDKVSPNATSIELEKGEPLLITFDADRGGELHVHSKPEQYVDFEAGTSRQRIVITTPGVVEIEDHDTNDVLAVLEVR